ncbi:MAG: nickel-dependent hydrogenase large subunit [Deltaproteobacteria bacterium]|jgi:hydrogenase large subunit|nr:nickel-dependent hydrogenase large subunit [Deltaproteobacteria bacterium]
MAKLIAIDPFNRIEGDLRIEIEVDANKVISARSSGIMFRGFERIMPGRAPMDALVITPRICGICSGSHGVAASKALAQAQGAEMPENGFHMKNFILGTEVVMSHLSHFYLLFAPDLANPLYKKQSVYETVKQRFTAMSGTSVMLALKARQSTLELMGLVGGKWPNSLAIHPTGTTSTMNLSSLTRAIGILNEFRDFLEKRFLGCTLSEWLDIDSLDKLLKWHSNSVYCESDLGLFLTMCLEAGLDRIGKGPNRYMSYGAYDLPDGSTWLPEGYYDGRSRPFDQALIKEHIGVSFFRDAVEARHPLEGVTSPLVEKKGAYSWTKAPRYNGKTVEVGPLARMIIADEPLLTDMIHQLDSSVMTRMFARLREMCKLTKEMSGWLERINPNEPFYGAPSSRFAANGIGLIEAARGSLGHWMKISSNLIDNYQVVTPSAWNMSPRDENGQPGPVEQALTGASVADTNNPVEVNLIIRSFDPCMSCSVH